MALSQGFHHTNRSWCRNYPWGIWSELRVKSSKGALSNGCRQEQMYMQVPYSTQAQQFSVWGNWYGNSERSQLVKLTPNHQQKPFPAHDNRCTRLWLHFPWNSLNFWLGLRRNCYWHSKHTLLSELNRGSWDIEVLHSSGASFVSQSVPLSVLQEHCEIFVENSWVCTLSEESLISANYQSFLKLLAISFQSFHLTENILSLMFLTFIYYFMEKHLKLPQLRNHHLIAWLETGMKTKRWWPLHWRL